MVWEQAWVAGDTLVRSSHESWYTPALAGTRPRRRVRGPEIVCRIPVRFRNALCTWYCRLFFYAFRADQNDQ